MSSLTKIPAGVQYFFDDDVRLRRYVERRAMETFEGWSYDEIILPMFDYHDLFARGMGEEQAERTYRFVDHDGALLALRPELTSLVARTVATRFKNKLRPLRICYSGERSFGMTNRRNDRPANFINWASNISGSRWWSPILKFCWSPRKF